MQEPLKFPRQPKPHNSRDIPREQFSDKDDNDAKDGELKVTLERPESLKARDVTESSEVSEQVASDVASKEASEVETTTAAEADRPAETSRTETVDAAELAEALDARDAREISETTDEPSAKNEASGAEESRDSSYSYYSSRLDTDPPTATQHLKTPLLVLVAVASLIAAGWNYTRLEEARAQLATSAQSKASVDQSLADAQGRLAAAEKAMADVKAALAAVPAGPKAAPAAK